MLLGERLTSALVTPSVAGGHVLMGMSWREGLAVLGASEESSLTLTSVGSGSPT